MLIVNQDYVDFRNQFTKDIAKSLTIRAKHSKRFKGKAFDIDSKLEELKQRRKSSSNN